MNEEKEAQIQVNLSNDNIFDSERAARYNSYLARIRAIQSNTPLIRSAKGTFSGIFSTFGREVEVIEKTPEILIGFVELG
jgi:apolipoprotein N-acyltransferase